MKRRFHTLDVFTTRAFAGNPLAVVLDAEGLDEGAMQRITTEFNLSETVFVTAPKDPVNTAAMRIFTPGKELPFAGHPTIGTAILLARLQASETIKGAGGIVVALEQRIGLVKVEVSETPAAGVRAVFETPKRSERLEGAFDAAAVAKALGIDVSDIGAPGHAISFWSAGVPYVMVPVSQLSAMARLKPGDPTLWRQAFGHVGDAGVFAYASETVVPEHHIHARMFWPGAGIAEDPATGSAAAAFAGLAATFEKPADGTHQLIIEQGYEMGRPSEIALDIDIEHGQLAAARIGGSAVLMWEGTFRV